MATEALSSETIVILIGAAIALTVILALILVRKLGKSLLIGGGLVAVSIFGRAMWSQAQATQETAQAAEATARAVTLLAVALIIVVILALAAVAFFWVRAWRAERRADRAMGQITGGWRPDPNARWGRNAQLPAQTTGGDAESLLPLLIGQMAVMQTMMMAWLQQQDSGGLVIPQPPPSLPAGQNYEEWVELPPDDWWNDEEDIVGGWL